MAKGFQGNLCTDNNNSAALRKERCTFFQLKQIQAGMKTGIIFIIIAAWCIYTSPLTASEIKRIPSSEELTNAAFAEAWIAFRRDIDGLCGSRVDARLSTAWFDEMSQSMLRDILKSASDHEVIYQAALRLARMPSNSNRALLSELQIRYEGIFLGKLIGSAGIKAGNRSVRSQALADLKSPVWEIRAAAGVMLAAAKENAGISYFRSVFKNGGEEGDFATWALGRFGSREEELAIKQELNKQPGNIALRAALGESVFKRIFPNLYLAFLAQFRFFSDGISTEGLYDSWFVAVEHSVSDGADNNEALRRNLLKLKGKPIVGEDIDIWDRRITLFIEFIEQTETKLKTTATPKWPKDFEDALQAVRTRPSRENPNYEMIFYNRVASFISLIKTIGPKVNFEELSEPENELGMISPGANRAIDGNIATSQYLQKNTPLVLTHKKKSILKTIDFLSWCPDHVSQERQVSIVVEGLDENAKQWTVKGILNTNRFGLQKITVNRISYDRINISIVDLPDKELTCITEIKCQF